VNVRICEPMGKEGLLALKDVTVGRDRQQTESPVYPGRAAAAQEVATEPKEGQFNGESKVSKDLICPARTGW